MIIGVTGNSMEEELAEFRKSGADLVLTKPLSIACLDLLIAYIRENGNKVRKKTRERNLLLLPILSFTFAPLTFPSHTHYPHLHTNTVFTHTMQSVPSEKLFIDGEKLIIVPSKVNMNMGVKK